MHRLRRATTAIFPRVKKQQQNYQHRNNIIAPIIVTTTLDPFPSLLIAALATSTIVIVDSEEKIQPGLVIKSLPTFTLKSVSEITNTTDKTLVVFKSGVYDITEFIQSHPGGVKQISLAAGGSIEPYWALYGAHHKSDIYELLESYRVGNLHEDDILPVTNNSNNSSLYKEEPTRHPALKVNSSEPFNAEPPSELLMTEFITPNDLFFVRNHLPVPHIENIESYRLQVNCNNESLQFSLQDLQTKFKKVSVTTTIQCAGNRRSEMSSVKDGIKGLSWDKTAIGTATWTGVRLSDVLNSLNVCEDSYKHVHFEGLDLQPGNDKRQGYGASIPIETALDARKDVILAFEMNGVPIPRDHGYPLRVIVPGTVGARNVKFLSSITLSTDESPSFWQQKDYKGFPPNVTYDSTSYWTRAGPSIQELPVQSAITEPSDGTEVSIDEPLVIKGYAWSGGGRGIIRVDVSLDGGKSWREAELHEDGKNQKYNKAWAWTPWVLVVEDVEELLGKDDDDAVLDIRCKAVDSSYNSQPDTIAPIWNMRGVLNNAWHCINIGLKKTEDD